MRKNRCAICDDETGNAHWVCEKCKGEHNLRSRPYTEWPGWVRALVNQEQHERRYHQVWDDLLTDLQVADGPQEDKAPRPPTRRRPLLPYAPYPTDEENRQYRRANRIPEDPPY